MIRHLFLLLALCVLCRADAPPTVFGDPIVGFSTALLPVLQSFEKASVETTLRGFIARGDTFPGYRASDVQPSDAGLYLNVGVSENVAAFSDEKKQQAGFTERLVQIPAPSPGLQGLVIEFDYGANAEPAAIRAVEGCLATVVKEFQKKREAAK